MSKAENPDSIGTLPDPGLGEDPHDAQAQASSDEPDDAADEVRHAQALNAFEAATHDTLEKVVGPFAEVFSKVHAVTLRELPTAEVVPELAQVDGEVRAHAEDEIQELVTLRGQLEPWLKAGSLTVRTLQHGPKAIDGVVNLSQSATRSIRLNLPKVNAQGRDFARQFARTARTHRGKLGLGLAIAGTLTIAWAWRADNADRKTREEEQRRQETLQEEAARRAELVDDLNRQRLRAEVERLEEATEVLSRLVDLGVGRLPALRELVANSADYSTYSTQDRLSVAELAGMAEVLVAVISSQQHAPKLALDEDHDESGALQAAQALLDRVQSPRSTASALAAPAASWSLGTLNAAPQRNQLTYLLGEPEYLQKLAARCGNAHQGVQDGFHFEWAHELSFNLDAISKDSELRVRMTERLGLPHDPADLVVQSPTGDTARQVQAKAVTSRSQRVGPENGLSDPKYTGMDLLVPTDHVSDTHAFLDKALDRGPANLYADNYRDAKARITDTITAGDISSDPITTGELTAIAKNPNNFIRRLVADTRKKQAMSTGLAAGGTATVMSLAAETTQLLVSEGHLDGRNWVQAGVSAARTGVASALAASGGSYLQTGALLAVDAGTANWLQTSLAHGDHGPALTQATVEVAAIAHGFVTGRITAEEAAKAVAQVVVESSIIWACTVVARRLIPDAEIAAMVGGIAGQVCSRVVIQGLRMAWLGRDTAQQWDAAYEALLADTAALERACSQEREELEALSDMYRARFADDVVPALDKLSRDGYDVLAGQSVAGSTGPSSAFDDLAAIANHFGHATQFSDLDAFDAFMSDTTTTLVLDPAPRSGT